MKLALAEDISGNGTIIHQLVAAKNLRTEAVVAMVIASALWKSVKPSVFIVKNCFLVAMIQLFPTKVLNPVHCMFQFQYVNNENVALTFIVHALWLACNPAYRTLHWHKTEPLTPELKPCQQSLSLGVKILSSSKIKVNFPILVLLIIIVIISLRLILVTVLNALILFIFIYIFFNFSMYKYAHLESMKILLIYSVF